MLKLYRAVINKMQLARLPPEIIDKILIESRHITLCWLHSEYALEKTYQMDPYIYIDPKKYITYNKEFIKDMLRFDIFNPVDLLIESIRINRYKIFKYLLPPFISNEIDMVDRIIDYEDEIMSIIVEHNRKKMFIKMLNIFDIYKIQSSYSAINVMCEYNYVGLFKILLNRGHYPSGGNSVVDSAVYEGDIQIINFILSHKLYDLKYDLEKDLLLQIIEKDHFALFEILIKRRHLHNVDFSYNNNCLIKAAVTKSRTKIVQLLLNLPIECGIDVMSIEDDIDLVQMALDNADIHILEILLERISQSKNDINTFKKNVKSQKYIRIFMYNFDKKIINFIEKTLNLTFLY